jgi:DNA ligase-1
MTETRFPRLYKKTSTGKIQEWDIKVHGNHVITTHGYEGGAKQTGEDVIHEGKNIGKKNATTPETQALAEAQSRWELKKTKNGYAETVEAAQAGETEHEGGIFPMLAKSFAKDGSKITFPCAVQPKLDGIRCIAVIDDGKVSLWSRTRKPIDGLLHIHAALTELFPVGQHVLDGELYNHALKDEFERIVSAVRGGKNHVELVEYHIYDYPSLRGGWRERENAIINAFEGASGFEPLIAVETTLAEDVADLMEAFEYFRGEGYEGAMVRNLDGKYVEGKRSADLQKLKEFEDAEFEVVDIEEGRGKLAGHVGAFVCVAASGERFNAKLMGELANLKTFFEGPADAWKGQLLTVRYQGLTNGGVPRFPVGVRFREKHKGGVL